MKRILSIFALLLGLMAGGANASPVPLLGRDINGNPVDAFASNAVFEYDPNLKITWLRDWNYSGTLMDYDTANIWASNLRVGPFSGWRLPYGDINCTGVNWNCTGSEIGYLWYSELNNVSNQLPPIGPFVLSNSGPFKNFIYEFWTSTYYFGVVPDTVLTFNVFYGLQRPSVKGGSLFVVAVRDGDVAASVPEPATVALLSLSLGVMGWVVRRKNVASGSAGALA